MDDQEILYTVNDGVACITLNRPNRLNAWTRVMAGEVRNAVYAAARDDAVRVIVLTGAGRGFCAGADMAELEDVSGQGVTEAADEAGPEQAVSILTGIATEEELDPDNPMQIRADFRKRYSYLQAVGKPVIAAINGPAAGLGLIIALYCDLRFASDKAVFSTAFARRGLIAEHGISWLLPRIVGMSNALDLLFSARRLSAAEALAMGLVNRVLPDDVYFKDVMSYATMLAHEVSPRSLAVIKKQVYEAQFQSLSEAIIDADAALVQSLRSGDFREGVAHFVEKRPPRFTGR